MSLYALAGIFKYVWEPKAKWGWKIEVWPPIWPPFMQRGKGQILTPIAYVFSWPSKIDVAATQSFFYLHNDISVVGNDGDFCLAVFRSKKKNKKKKNCWLVLVYDKENGWQLDRVLWCSYWNVLSKHLPAPADVLCVWERQRGREG